MASEDEPVDSPLDEPSGSNSASALPPGRVIGQNRVDYVDVADDGRPLKVHQEEARAAFLSHDYAAFRDLDWSAFGGVGDRKGHLDHEPQPTLRSQIAIVISRWVAIHCGQYILRRRGPDRTVDWIEVSDKALKAHLRPYRLRYKLSGRWKEEAFFDIWERDTYRLWFYGVEWKPYPPALIGGKPDDNPYYFNTFKPLAYPIHDLPVRRNPLNLSELIAPINTDEQGRPDILYRSEFHVLVKHLFTDCDPHTFRVVLGGKTVDSIELFYDILAWKIQHPAEQLPLVIWLMGEEGCGKGTLVSFLRALYGNHNFVKVNDLKRCTQQFNKHMQQLWIHVDEANSFDEYFLTWVKAVTGGDKQLLEKKYGSAYEALFCATIIITCNPLSTADICNLSITHQDRRWFANACSGGLRGQREVFDELRVLLGIPAYINELAIALATRDLSGFNPNIIPRTRLRAMVMQRDISPAARVVQVVASRSRNNTTFYGPRQTGRRAHPRQTEDSERDLWSRDDEGCKDEAVRTFGPWPRRMYWSYELLWEHAKPILYKGKKYSGGVSSADAVADFVVEKTKVLDEPYQFRSYYIDGKLSLALPVSYWHVREALMDLALWTEAPSAAAMTLDAEIQTLDTDQQPNKRQRTEAPHPIGCWCNECH